MKLLDLFCGAGGCSVGYHRAGFTDIVGVDTNRAALRRYPYTGVRMDAMTALTGGIDLDAFDAVHASPPCQAYSAGTRAAGADRADLYSGHLLVDTLAALTEWGERTGRPWIVENVPGAESYLTGTPCLLEMCGAHRRAYDPLSSRTLRLRRHRLFATNVPMMNPLPCSCDATTVGGVYGAGAHTLEHARTKRSGGYTPPVAVRRSLMGLDHMTTDQLSQAIPPDYTEALGWQLINHVRAEAVA